jgi:chromosome partitioning protein
MIVATANVKGGVGKSTLAAHLASWVRHIEGVEVAFVDCDVQETGSRWLREVDKTIPLTRVISPDAIRATLIQLKAQYPVVIVDGPAGLTDVNLRILLACDMALVPCGPTAIDIEASQLAVQVIKEAQDSRGNGLPRAIFIPNKVQMNTKLGKELLEVASEIGIPVATRPIRLRQVYAECRGIGKTVFQMGTKGKEAADDLIKLFSEVFNIGGTEGHAS